MNMNITPQDIKIKIKLLNSTTILAQATVILFDCWEEHGWKILKSNRIDPISQEEIWIQAPSYRLGNGWKEIVFINDRELYDTVLSKIYDAYHMAKSKNDGQKSVENYDETQQ